MSFLLDTDICSSYIRGIGRVVSRFTQNPGSLHVSVVTITELEMWLMRPKTPIRHQQSFMAMRGVVTRYNVTEAIAHRAARLGNQLRGQSRRVGLADLLIGATALEEGLTLVTHSTRTFANFPGLAVVDWLVP